MGHSVRISIHREMPRQDKGKIVSECWHLTDPLIAPGFSFRHSCINFPQHQCRCSRSRLLEVPENGEKSLNVKRCQNILSLKRPSFHLRQNPIPTQEIKSKRQSRNPKTSPELPASNTTMLFRTRSDFFHLVLLWPLG